MNKEALQEFNQKIYLIEHEMVAQGIGLYDLMQADKPYMIGSFNATEFLLSCQKEFICGTLDPRFAKILQRKGLIEPVPEEKFDEEIDKFLSLLKAELEKNPGLSVEEILNYRRTVQKNSQSKVVGYKLGGIDVYRWLIWARKMARDEKFTDAQKQRLTEAGVNVSRQYSGFYSLPRDFESAIEILRDETLRTGLTLDQIAYIKRVNKGGKREAVYYKIGKWNASVWLARQKHNYHIGELTPQQIEMLESMGFSIRFGFDAAMKLIDQEMEANPGVTINDMAKCTTTPDGKRQRYIIDGHDMTSFLEGLKEKYTYGMLPKKQEEELRRRGFVFSKQVSLEEGVRRIKKILESGQADLATLGRLTKGEDGKLEGYEVDGWKVSFWLRKVRARLNKEKLSPEQEEKLATIGVVKFAGRNIERDGQTLDSEFDPILPESTPTEEPDENNPIV